MRTLNIHNWVYLGEDASYALEVEAKLLGAADRIAIAPYLEESARTLREPYIDWIGQLSTRNASMAWWGSEIAAKSPFAPLYVRLCCLEVARKIADLLYQKRALVICSTPTLADCIAQLLEGERIPTARLDGARHWKVRGGVWRARLKAAVGRHRRLVSLLRPHSIVAQGDPIYRYRKLQAFRTRWPLEMSGPDTVMFFTWVDDRNLLRDGSYHDPNFGVLPSLVRRSGLRVSYIARVLPIANFQRIASGLLLSGDNFCFPEEFLIEQDYTWARAQAQGFSPDLSEDEEFNTLPARALGEEFVEQTRSRLEAAVLYERLVYRLASGGMRPKQIVYTSEGQPWEHVLNWSLRRHLPDTRSVAYENGTFSQLFHSMYPAADEVGLKPMPDRLVTNGDLSYRALSTSYLPQELIRRGCGIRHSYLWDNRYVAMRPQKESRPTIVVGTSGIVYEAMELVSRAVEAFKGRDDCLVVIRLHPLLKGSNSLHRLLRRTLGPNVIYAPNRVVDTLRDATVLLYTSSYLCYEALAFDVVPIAVWGETFVTVDMLDQVPNARLVASTPAEIRSAVDAVTSWSAQDWTRWRRHAMAALRSAIRPVDDTCVSAFLV